MTIQISEKSNMRALKSGVSFSTAHPTSRGWEPASLLSYAIQAAYSDDDNEDEDDEDEDWEDEDEDEDDDDEDWEDEDEDDEEDE